MGILRSLRLLYRRHRRAEADIKTKALEVIEVLSEGSFMPSEKLLEDIYKFSHSALGICRHYDWVHELEELHQRMVDEGAL
jgi:hypothetical protein